MKTSISLSDDILNSSDIDKQIDFLKIGLDSTPFDVDEYSERLREILAETPSEWFEHYEEDEIEELLNWLELRDLAKEYNSEWRHGAELIYTAHSTEYAKQLAEDTGDVPEEKFAQYIDWEVYAEDLKVDYTEISVDGYDFYVRTT